MMPVSFEQGDILKVENISKPVFIASKNFFNQHEQAVVCPAVSKAAPDPLHIPVRTKEFDGIILCEQLKFLDLGRRGYQKITHLPLENIMDLTDAIQGIFDYYPYHL